MRRFLVLFILVLALAIAIAGGLMWQFIFTSPPHPVSATVPGLSADATVRWNSSGPVHVVAATNTDALAALGFVHGQERAWPVELWRQTAEGRLAEWFGPGVRPLDRHTRRLGFARHAREAFEALPPVHRQRLRAYVHGLNAALQTEHVRDDAPFVTLGLSPSSWEPWHPLAIERLIAWLSGPPLASSDTLQAASRDVDAFLDADARLRGWLHLHGLDRSVAWAVASDSTASTPDVTLVSRLVMGSSALPILQDVVIDRSGAPTLRAGSIPGTLLLPVGVSNGRSWSLLPGSDARLTRLPVDTSRVRSRFERIHTVDGDESLVTVHRIDAGLPFPRPDDALRASVRRIDSLDALVRRTDSLAADSLVRERLTRDSLYALSREADRLRDRLRDASDGVDTTWVLRWPGLTTVSDVGAGLRLAGWTDGSGADSVATDATARSDTGFRLFDGVGLVVDAAGQHRVLGAPPAIHQNSRRVLVGRTPWLRYQAARIDSLLALKAPVSPARWTASDSSAWAAQTLQSVLPSLAPMGPGDSETVRDALAYVRNWNAVYDRASIGASIFDTWMRVYRDRIGALPTADDSTFFADVLRRRAFSQAVDTLLASQGTDLRQWRWERVAPDRRFFPVWSADSLVATDLSDLASTRYAALDRPGRGHASTLSGGPALVDGSRPAPTTWTAWTDPARSTLTARRLRFDPGRFLNRPLMDGARPAPVRLDVPDDASATTLHPAE